MYIEEIWRPNPCDPAYYVIKIELVGKKCSDTQDLIHPIDIPDKRKFCVFDRYSSKGWSALTGYRDDCEDYEATYLNKNYKILYNKEVARLRRIEHESKMKALKRKVKDDELFKSLDLC